MACVLRCRAPLLPARHAAAGLRAALVSQPVAQASYAALGVSQMRGFAAAAGAGGAATNTMPVPPGRAPRLDSRVVSINRVGKTTKGGRTFRFSALVVAGNGTGGAGFGLGKGTEVSKAVGKAIESAKKNMMYIKRCNDATLFHDVEFKYAQTKVLLRAAPPGTGIRANKTIGAVCRVIGLQDVVAKTFGSRNPHNILRATFHALDQMQDPGYIAMKRGLVATQRLVEKGEQSQRVVM